MEVIYSAKSCEEEDSDDIDKQNPHNQSTNILERISSDSRLSSELISYIKSKNANVLTEHIGDNNLLKQEKSLTDKEIYLRDIAWLKECDVVIAECTRPSLGVGYELAFAEKLNKPVNVLYRNKECNLSAMISGDDYFNIFSYETKEEAFNIIDKILNN